MKCNGRARAEFVRALILSSLALIASATVEQASAQVPPSTGVSSAIVVNNVGGIYVDADGLLQNTAADSMGKLRELRRKAMQQLDGDLQEASSLRKVSLRRLEEAIAKSLAEKKPLPDDIQFLAGLQRVRYVLVFPEQNDIVLAGPAEGWHVDGTGSVVGTESGQPTMQLDDLLVALRSTRSGSPSVISCSIDPTPEGTKRVQAVFDQIKDMSKNTQKNLHAIEEALGPQVITVTGVPATSHFARVLVAADYRMKRLAMNLEKTPIANMPSYMTMLKNSSVPDANLMPRWWLAPKYEPMLRDEESLTWEIRGASVAAMTEDDFVAANGQRQPSGKKSALAQKWADSMTENYDELAHRIPVFGELQNLMDFAIVAALIERHDLVTRAGVTLTNLLAEERLPSFQLGVPKQVPTKASLISRRRDYVVSASGGVQMNAWSQVDAAEKAKMPAVAGMQTMPNDSTRWWWD